MKEYYRQKIDISLDRSSELYSRIERYAEKHELSIENVVIMLTLVGIEGLMTERMDTLERWDTP